MTNKDAICLPLPKMFRDENEVRSAPEIIDCNTDLSMIVNTSVYILHFHVGVNQKSSVAIFVEGTSFSKSSYTFSSTFYLMKGKCNYLLVVEVD